MFKVKETIRKNKDSFWKFSSMDWIILGIIILFCFLAYSQAGDILHTGASSFAILNGHIFDFYDYNVDFVGGNSYMLTTYLVFAIWNIPIKLLGLVSEPTMGVSVFVFFWYNLLTALLYFGTGYCVKLICKELKMDEKTSNFAMFLFLSNPIGIYSQFIFGQYDIVTTFFMTLGLYYFLKRDTWKYLLFFSIAIT